MCFRQKSKRFYCITCKKEHNENSICCIDCVNTTVEVVEKGGWKIPTKEEFENELLEKIENSTKIDLLKLFLGIHDKNYKKMMINYEQYNTLLSRKKINSWSIEPCYQMILSIFCFQLYFERNDILLFLPKSSIYNIEGLVISVYENMIKFFQNDSWFISIFNDMINQEIEINKNIKSIENISKESNFKIIINCSNCMKKIQFGNHKISFCTEMNCSSYFCSNCKSNYKDTFEKVLIRNSLYYKCNFCSFSIHKKFFNFNIFYDLKINYKNKFYK
jgi:hypothetical protein